MNVNQPFVRMEETKKKVQGKDKTLRKWKWKQETVREREREKDEGGWNLGNKRGKKKI